MSPVISNSPAPRPRAQDDARARQVEIYVCSKFNDFEVASVAQVLGLANATLGTEQFVWRFVSSTPGLVTGQLGMIVRAEPVVDNHTLPDVLVVVGGSKLGQTHWQSRMRQMVRLARDVVLLSDAATRYVLDAKSPSGPVTTHWRDAHMLREIGHYPTLSSHLSEKSSGIRTAAGMGATAETMIGVLAKDLSSSDVTELSNRLLLPVLRKSHAEQTIGAARHSALFDPRARRALDIMETTLDAPLSIAQITRHVGVSARHLERIFKEVYGTSPARFYKLLRVKHARSLIEETTTPLMDVAAATGFSSSAALSEAIKSAYGASPSKMRKSSARAVLSTAKT